MAEKTNVPEIRFAGFTDPWEQRKLGELGFAQSGIGFPNTEQGGTEGTPFFKVSDMNMSGNEHELVASNNYVTPEQIARMGWHPINQVPAIFFAKVGAAVMLNRKRLINKPFLMDNNTMAFSMDSSLLNTQFGQSLFERLDLTCLIQVGALPSYNSSDVESITVSLPSTMDEQRQIGECLCNINDLITLHQRKYDKLCAVKKSMLDKMFPKSGEIEPEIRFAGFTDPWEQRKLGDVATIVGGGTPSTNNDAYWDGDIDWYSPAELGEQVYADRSVRRITQAGYDSCSATLLPAGKTILFTSRAGIGNTAILRRSACTNQGFQSLVMNDDIDVYFVYSMTNRIKKFAEQKASGSTFLEISGKGLAAGEFAFPSKDEQTAIGSMFKQLDHLITLHQRELNLLKNTKKSLLDKMFV